MSFSWKRALGVTRAKQSFARMTGIPTSRSGRQRKIGSLIEKAFTGGGTAHRRRSSSPVHSALKSSSIKIPGLSFSWKRALGVTRVKQEFSRATGIPTSRSGRQRKIGELAEHAVFLPGLFAGLAFRRKHASAAQYASSPRKLAVRPEPEISEDVQKSEGRNSFLKRIIHPEKEMYKIDRTKSFKTAIPYISYDLAEYVKKPLYDKFPLWLKIVGWILCFPVMITIKAAGEKKGFCKSVWLYVWLFLLIFLICIVGIISETSAPGYQATQENRTAAVNQTGVAKTLAMMVSTLAAVPAQTESARPSITPSETLTPSSTWTMTPTAVPPTGTPWPSATAGYTGAVGVIVPVAGSSSGSASGSDAVVIPTDSECDPAYIGCCVPLYGKYSCSDLEAMGCANIQVIGYDRLRLDRDGNGIACQVP